MNNLLNKIADLNFSLDQKKRLISLINDLISISGGGLPDDAKPGQILSIDKKSNPVWKDTVYTVEKHAYGIRWIKENNTCTRVGNMELHKTCPIQNRLVGVLHDGRKILKYLNPDGWGLKASDGSIPVLDGTQGDVGVAMEQEYFIKVFDLTDAFELYISDYNIDGTWLRISPIIYSPTNTLTRINSNGVEEAFNACIAADDKNHLGGFAYNYDTEEIPEEELSKFHGIPRTEVTIPQCIEFCNNRGNGIEMLDYKHWCALMVLYFIEYANFDSQADINLNLTEDGFKQGGLGEGATSLDSNYWEYYNSFVPIIHTKFMVEKNIGNKSYCLEPYIFGSQEVYPAYYHGINVFGEAGTWCSDILFAKNQSSNDLVNVYKVPKSVDITTITLENINELCILLNTVPKNINNDFINEWSFSNNIFSMIPNSGTSKECSKEDVFYINYNNDNITVALLGSFGDLGAFSGLGFLCAEGELSAAAPFLGFMTMTELEDHNDDELIIDKYSSNKPYDYEVNIVNYGGSLGYAHNLTIEKLKDIFQSDIGYPTYVNLKTVLLTYIDYHGDATKSSPVIIKGIAQSYARYFESGNILINKTNAFVLPNLVIKVDVDENNNITLDINKTDL